MPHAATIQRDTFFSRKESIPLAAHRCAIAIPTPCPGAPMAALPRNRLACSATGSASPISAKRNSPLWNPKEKAFGLCAVINAPSPAGAATRKKDDASVQLPQKAVGTRRYILRLSPPALLRRQTEKLFAKHFDTHCGAGGGRGHSVPCRRDKRCTFFSQKESIPLDTRKKRVFRELAAACNRQPRLSGTRRYLVCA